MADLQIVVDDVDIQATWIDENPDVRRAIADVLPMSGDATRWGDELYFATPVDVEPETTREQVPVGAVAYWPGGNALCLFWGSTPASTGDEPRAAAPVNVVAEIEDVSPLASLDGSARVAVREQP